MFTSLLFKEDTFRGECLWDSIVDQGRAVNLPVEIAFPAVEINMCKALTAIPRISQGAVERCLIFIVASLALSLPCRFSAL